MINGNCKIGREELPVLPCNYFDCSWFVHEKDYCNCFWLVADIMHRFPCVGAFTIAEIAIFEGLTEKEIIGILEKAQRNIRTKHQKLLLDI